MPRLRGIPVRTLLPARTLGPLRRAARTRSVRPQDSPFVPPEVLCVLLPS